MFQRKYEVPWNNCKCVNNQIKCCKLSIFDYTCARPILCVSVHVRVRVRVRVCVFVSACVRVRECVHAWVHCLNLSSIRTTRTHTHILASRLLMILSMWTVIPFPCACLRLLQHWLCMGTSLLYVLVMVDSLWCSLKTGTTLKQLSLRARVCGGVCSLPHGKLSLADSVATEQSLPFQTEPMA